MQKSAQAFRTIAEVASILGVAPHVLRFWEQRFVQVAPIKGAGGRRYYRPEDLSLMAGLRILLQDEGLTTRGVQKRLAEQGVAALRTEGQAWLDAQPPLPEPARKPARRGADVAHVEAQPEAEGAPVVAVEAQAGVAPQAERAVEDEVTPQADPAPEGEATTDAEDHAPQDDAAPQADPAPEYVAPPQADTTPEAVAPPQPDPARDSGAQAEAPPAQRRGPAPASLPLFPDLPPAAPAPAPTAPRARPAAPATPPRFSDPMADRLARLGHALARIDQAVQDQPATPQTRADLAALAQDLRDLADQAASAGQAAAR
ncbi:MerR family transcriptional regulator [Paracoccus sp. p4-l81]|uniref:MerR family transcriptional regulator n=1 Tax=Paracoccus sp. p4-l81 TaxID=3342806 RepID=UPI0035B937C9